MAVYPTALEVPLGGARPAGLALIGCGAGMCRGFGHGAGPLRLFMEADGCGPSGFTLLG